MLVNGFGDIYHETGIQNGKTALPEKPFQAEKNIPKQEKVLGIGFLNAPAGNISYGMRAEYAEDSTTDNPVIKVTIQKIGSEEVHFIHVNDVNVRSASEVEMFALCCYADDTGQGTGGKFGTWQTLNYYRTNASDHGGFQLTKSVDLCLSLKQDWLSMVEQMRKLYFESGLYKQALDGDSLLGFLSGHDLETDSHKDFQTPDSGNRPVHEVYESMSQGGMNHSFTSIGVYNMGYHTSLYLSDAGYLTCSDDKEGGKVLWEIPVNGNQYSRIEELMKEGQDFVLRDKKIVEEYLKGMINLEDIQRLRDVMENDSVYDDFFGNCSEDVQKAWENVQGTDKLGSFNGNLDEKVYFLTEIDKYVLMYLSNNIKEFDGSLESTIRFVEDIANSLKDSLNLYSSKMQKLKLKELEVLEKFKEELSGYMDA